MKKTIKGKLKNTLMVLVLACFAGTIWAQDPFADVKIEVIPVAGAVYMLTGYGGNIGLSVGEDGLLLVDDQFAELAPKIQEAMAGLKAGEPSFLLNTHWHGDHTGGNHVFGEHTTIIAHHNVRRRLGSDPDIKGKKAKDPKPKGWPVITFDQSLMIHFNGETIKVNHLRKGHTDGDSVIFFTKSKVVHMGDLFFNGLFPFVDLESGGNVDGYLNNMEKMAGIIPADYKVIPGHGPLATVEDLKKDLKGLRDSVAYIRKKLSDGKKLEHLVKEGLPEQFDRFNWRFIDTESWIRAVAGSSK